MAREFAHAKRGKEARLTLAEGGRNHLRGSLAARLPQAIPRRGYAGAPVTFQHGRDPRPIVEQAAQQSRRPWV